MTMLLGACASSSSVRDIVQREIPGPPGYLQPVLVAEPKKGENALTVAVRERAGRLKANTIIRNARDQWEKLRAAYRARR